MIIYFSGPAHVESLGSKVMPGAALSSLVWPSAATGHSFLLPPPGTPWQHLFDPAFVGPLIVVLALAALFFARRHRVVLLLWAATLWSIALSWGGATRLTGSNPTFSWHAPAWYLSKAIPILKNPGWIRISILTDLLLALLVAITLEGVTSAIQANGGVWRHYLGDVAAGGAGVLMVLTTARSGQCALYRIRKCGRTGRTSTRADRKKRETIHRARVPGRRAVLRNPISVASSR